MRLIGDLIAFCTDEMPLWYPVSISGYHMREAGATATQELAFTLADGLAYVEHLVARGVDPDRFLPRFSFYFNVHMDLFEDVAKIRAARRLWATLMRERVGARDPRSWQLRTHVQTSGVSLTAQQPLLNVARVAIEALGAVLSGAQSVHTAAYDETLSIPTRRVGDPRAAHAADDRRGDRRGLGGRPARWLVLRRGPDRRDRGGGDGGDRADRRPRRDGRGRRGGLPPGGDRRSGVRLPAPGGARRAADRGRQRPRGDRRRGPADPPARPRRRRAPDRRRPAAARAPRRRGARARARRACAAHARATRTSCRT